MKNSIIFAIAFICFFTLNLQAQQSAVLTSLRGAETTSPALALASSVATDSQPTHHQNHHMPTDRAGIQAARFEGLEEYIAANLIYPESARAAALEGMVQVAVELSPEGKVQQVEVIKSLSSGCDEAVVTMLNTMPDWKPAMNQSTPVKTRIRLNVNFELTR